MGGVHGFVTEDAVDGEVAGRGKASWLVSKFIKHLGGDGGGMRSEEILEGLCDFNNVFSK